MSSPDPTPPFEVLGICEGARSFEREERAMQAMRASLWVDADGRRTFEEMQGPIETDVAVIGAGIVGTTAALLLRQLGLDVVLLEARRVGEQVTGGSSAKVTSQHSLIYGDLTDTFGEALARRYGEANQWAIGDIESRARAFDLDCAFERRAAYAYSIDTDRVEALRREAEVAARLGLPARFTTDPPLPFATAGAVVFDDQAQFDPFAYTIGVAEALRRAGGRVFEGVRVTDLDDRSGRVQLETTGGAVGARDVLLTTNLPFVDDGLYYARTVPRAHAVLAARVPEAPVDGMFISIDSPTRSLRSARRGDSHWLLAVGPSFAPGDADATHELAELEAFARQHFDVQFVDYGWWNEDYYSVDRLPYVGRIQADREHVYVATGFGGWGITNGTVAAHVLTDAVRGLPNAWANIYDSTRPSPDTDTSPLTQAARMVRENLDTVKNLAARLLPTADGDPLSLAAGQGQVMNIDGENVAVARDDAGVLHAVSALCTHMGCELAWNGLMQTWDCGCHGSCFALDGAVLRGPAVSPLESRSGKVAAPEDAR